MIIRSRQCYEIDTEWEMPEVSKRSGTYPEYLRRQLEHELNKRWLEVSIGEILLE